MTTDKGGAEKLPESVWEKSEKQEPLVPPKKQGYANGRVTSNYETGYDEVAFKLLSESDTAKTDCHLCAALRCTPCTLKRWKDTFPSFMEAVTLGKKIGEAKWRDRLSANAFEPTAKVNNGLIKLLSSNVYGIKEDPTTQFTVVQQNVDPETYLREKGIPLPMANCFDGLGDIEPSQADADVVE